MIRPGPFLCAILAAGVLTPALPATTLSSLLREAQSRNPEIAAALRGWRASAQTPSQVRVLPDPEVSVQQLSVGSPRPFAGYSNSDFAYIGLGISQEIPYPGKLTLRAEAAQRDAAMSQARYEATRRSVFLQVKECFIQIAWLQKTLELIQRNQTVLKQIAQISEARYSLGQGTQQDVLKAQLQSTQLLSELAHHHELLSRQQALMSKLLNRAADAAPVEADELTETPLTVSSEGLLATVRTQNPEILNAQEAVNKRSLLLELARKDRYPDFTVQYSWQHTAAQFRDYHMLTFSARLPIYRTRKLDPEVTQATEGLNQSRREYESSVQQAYFDVRDQYIAATTASELLKIYREGTIPQALAVFRAGLAAYQAGTQNVASVLESFLDSLSLEEAYWKTVADHETALARLEEITGVAIRKE
jgi:cobalt-zinc-cadmium efflux system outer membrane protein